MQTSSRKAGERNSNTGKSKNSTKLQERLACVRERKQGEGVGGVSQVAAESMRERNGCVSQVIRCIL